MPDHPWIARTQGPDRDASDAVEDAIIVIASRFDVKPIAGNDVRVLTPAAAQAVRGSSWTLLCGRFGRIVDPVSGDSAVWDTEERNVVAYR